MQLLGQAEVCLPYLFGRSGLGDAEYFVWVFHWPSAKTDIGRARMAESIRQSLDSGKGNADRSRFFFPRRKTRGAGGDLPRYRGVVRIAMRVATIECCRVGFGERRAFLETLDEIGVGDEGAAEGDKIGGAARYRCIR